MRFPRATRLPLHRQEGIFQRAGVSIPRSTMGDMKCDLALLLRVVQGEMRRQLLVSHFIQWDDTPVGVLVEREGKKRKRKKVKGRIWVYIAPGGILVFAFTLSWSRDGPASFLTGFEGTHLQGDKYPGYDYVCQKDGLIKVGCWAHVRRKFVEAESADRRRSTLMPPCARVVAAWDRQRALRAAPRAAQGPGRHHMAGAARGFVPASSSPTPALRPAPEA